MAQVGEFSFILAEEAREHLHEVLHDRVRIEHARLEHLPAGEREELPGEPRRERPSDLEEIGAWVPVLALGSPLTRELFKGAVRVSNVARGLTLNPHLSRDQVMLVQAQYVPLSEVSSVAESSRAINRAQIELIASRVSALNQCFY